MNEVAPQLTASALVEAAAMVLGFVAALFAGSLIAPGRRLSAARRDHALNGLALFVAVVAVAAVGQAAGWFSLEAVYARFWPLFVAANGLAFAVAIALYVAGRRQAPVMAPGGLVAAARDFYFGIEHEPRWLGVDLKMFSYRPSLIGLVLINAAFAVHQYQTHGTVSNAMMLYQAFTFAYVLNYFQFEHGMMFTWDVVAERFGWMLVWGDYVLVPFFYSLPGWFLIDRVQPLSPPAIAGLVALYAFGFWLFRGANAQKHRFKQDPAARIWGRPAESLDGRLLVSGFWGIGRHLNYTGEVCVYLAFALTTGFESALPYLLPAWLAALLAHRAWRDERRCRAKYGPLWSRYVGRARFRMIPFVY